LRARKNFKKNQNRKISFLHWWDKVVSIPTTINQFPLSTLFFYNEYDLQLDPKNRLSIPAEVRKQIDANAGPDEDNEGGKIFVTLRNRVPCIYPARYYQQLVRSYLRPKLVLSESMVEFSQLKFAMSCKLPWDAQGRISLPEKILQRSGLSKDKEVTLIGMDDHLQIWPRAEWAAHSLRLLEKSVAIEKGAEALLETDKREGPIAPKGPEELKG
jgi:MraZ protein